MKSLFVSGFGVSLNVDSAKLFIKDGYITPNTTPSTYEIKPRHVPFDSIVIDSQSGQISLSALKWLMRHRIPLFVLDFNGTILSSILPKEPVVGNLKKAQFEAYLDNRKRFYIAKKLLEAKFEKTNDVIKWLSSRYEISIQDQSRLEKEVRRLHKSRNLKNLLNIEGRVAEVFWKIFKSIIPTKYSFQSRMHETHQMNSTDPVNTLLNYGYAFLESRCRAAINSVGLEPSIGFLHEIAQPKNPLVYDLQEPFRWIIDKTVISCIENEEFGKKDFFLTDNYVLRLKPQAIKRLLEELRLAFNSRVKYEGKNYSWDTIMQLKTKDLARYILGKIKEFDFIEPSPEFNNEDSKELREKILSLNLSEARKIGINKSSLWYLQKRARSHKPLQIYEKVKNKL